jgi:hypothetical protein
MVVGDLPRAMCTSQRSRNSTTVEGSVVTTPLARSLTNLASAESASLVVPWKVRVA